MTWGQWGSACIYDFVYSHCRHSLFWLFIFSISATVLAANQRRLHYAG